MGMLCRLLFLTPLHRFFHKRLIITQLVNKFPAFYGTRKFTSVFTQPCHWTLSCAICIQATVSLFLRLILALCPLFSAKISYKIFYALLISHAFFIFHASHPFLWVLHCWYTGVTGSNPKRLPSFVNCLMKAETLR
jgi:hypothetical protein